MNESMPAMGHVIKIDEARIQDHLGSVVRSTVEETLNGLLDAEADRLCKASRYERSEERADTARGTTSGVQSANNLTTHCKTKPRS